MVWFMIAFSIMLVLMIFVTLAMYDHMKMFKFLVENFITTVQKLCDNATRENKNVAANINALKDAVKDSNKINDAVKSIDSSTHSLTASVNILKSEVNKIRKG